MKSLIAILALVAVSLQAQEHRAVVVDLDGKEEWVDLWDYTDWGRNRPSWNVETLDQFGGPRPKWYRHISLPPFLRSVVVLDLRGNSLKNLVIPPGMIMLTRIKLSGNTMLTNLVLQQDTGVTWSTKFDGQPNASPDDFYNHHRTAITIELGGADRNNYLEKRKHVPLQSISAPAWLKGRVNLVNTTWRQVFDMEFIECSDSVEILSFHGGLWVC